MKQAVEIRNIGGPEVLCLWTRLLNPVGNCGQYITAALPPMEIGRAADWNLAAGVPLRGGGKQIPGISVLDDRGIVRPLNITLNLDHLRGRLGVKAAECRNEESRNQAGDKGDASNRSIVHGAHSAEISRSKWDFDWQ